jgi:hypothetical protein
VSERVEDERYTPEDPNYLIPILCESEAISCLVPQAIPTECPFEELGLPYIDVILCPILV